MLGEDGKVLLAAKIVEASPGSVLFKKGQAAEK